MGNSEIVIVFLVFQSSTPTTPTPTTATQPVDAILAQFDHLVFDDGVDVTVTLVLQQTFQRGMQECKNWVLINQKTLKVHFIIASLLLR